MSDQPSAFPINTTGQMSPDAGMTLLDYFAAHVDVSDQVPDSVDGCAKLLGIEPVQYHHSLYPKVVARVRYQVARAMLAERAKGSTP